MLCEGSSLGCLWNGERPGLKESAKVTVLFLSALLVFNANLRLVSAGDTIPASLIPFSLLLDGNLMLDRFYPWYKTHHPESLHIFHEKDNHIYSIYPVALPLLILPLYVPVVGGLMVSTWTEEEIVSLARTVEKLVASLIASLCGICLYLLLRRFNNDNIAISLTIIYYFGTSTWTISSQALWQHGAGQLMIICTLLFLEKYVGKSRYNHLIIAGLFVGSAIVIRVTNVLFFATSFLYFLSPRRDFKAAFIYSIFPILMGIGVAYYNYEMFGDVRGFYASQLSWFSTNFLEGVAGVLVSPGRGLFIYSPFLICIILSLILRVKGGRVVPPGLWATCVVFSVLQVLLIAKYSMWWGGWTYGPRYLSEILPCLMVILAESMRVIRRQRPLAMLFVTAVLLSVGTQAVGAFCYPRGQWDEIPVSVNKDPSRLWNWKDNPIVRTVLAGPDLVPHFNLVSQSRPLEDHLFRASYDHIEGPSKMKAGESEEFKITLSNRSTLAWHTWGGGGGINTIRLSYHFFAPDGTRILWDGNRAPLPYIVQPGQSVMVHLKVTAPQTTGDLILVIDLVQEGVSWFSRKGVEPAKCHVEVADVF
jgi:hypothetical protein